MLKRTTAAVSIVALLAMSPAAICKPNTDRDTVIRFAKDGKIFWNGRQISCAELNRRVPGFTKHPGVSCHGWKLTNRANGSDRIGFEEFEQASPAPASRQAGH